LASSSLAHRRQMTWMHPSTSYICGGNEIPNGPAMGRFEKVKMSTIGPFVITRTIPMGQLTDG
jgi:hypothetical protein